ncbi:hypothetical protein Tco_0399734, partial [Tanacetum coccineum]
MFVPNGSTLPTLQNAKDLQGDELLHYDAEIELMNLILLSIPNEIYNSVDACTTSQGNVGKRQFEKLVNASRAKKLGKSQDPLRSSSSFGFNLPVIYLIFYYVSILRSVVDYVDEYHRMMNSGNTGRNTRRAYVQEEVVEGSNAQNETRNDEAGVLLTDEQNDFLFADASRMEEIEELSANICLMARIQPANNTSDVGPSYDSAFISEVQSSSINENKEQMYPIHTKIINSTIGDDKINSNIIFEEPNGNVNSGSVEKDTHVPDLYALEQLARNAYKEAEKQQLFAQKVQQQNTGLMTSQLSCISESVGSRKTSEIIDLAVTDYKRKNEEIQKTHLILKRQMRENEDRYHDTIIDLEAKLKKNVDLILKLGNSLQGMFMLGPKPLSVYDPQLKHGLGYPNPNTLKQAISQCPKLYLASRLETVEKEAKEKHVVSKPITLQSSPGKQRRANSNKNVIAPGMYKVVITQESQTNEAKSGLSSTRMNAATSVRRPMNKDSHVKNSVLANSKNSTKKVPVYVRKNKQTDKTSANVISNKENVINVNVLNASKVKTLLWVSCMQNVLIPCHDKCLANYKLNVHSNARKDFTTNSRTPKSSDTTYVVLKTMFSEKLAQSKSLDTTSVVSKPKIDVGSILKAKHKVVQIVLWIVDSGCSKHITGDRSLLKNFIEKFMGTVRFGNDNFAAITGYG